MSWRSMLMATAVVSANPKLGSATDRLEITDTDLDAIRRVIEGQLQAFRRGDADAAFALSSEAIRDTFGDPCKLLALIQRNYAALTDARRIALGEFVITPEGLAQLVAVVDGAGTLHHAVYLLDQDDRGSWRANGCLMGGSEAVAA